MTIETLSNETKIYHSNDGSIVFIKNNRVHRDDGPAMILENGSKVWYKNDKIHREDGPAVEGIDGHYEWFLNDVKYSLNKWLKIVNLSISDKVLIKLIYGGR